MRVRVVRVILPARADRRAVGGLDYTRCIGSHYLSLDRFLSGCVRPSMEFVMQVLPASQLGWSRELFQDCRLTTD